MIPHAVRRRAPMSRRKAITKLQRRCRSLARRAAKSARSPPATGWSWFSIMRSAPPASPTAPGSRRLQILFRLGAVPDDESRRRKLRLGRISGRPSAAGTGARDCKKPALPLRSEGARAALSESHHRRHRRRLSQSRRSYRHPARRPPLRRGGNAGADLRRKGLQIPLLCRSRRHLALRRGSRRHRAADRPE